MNIIFVVIVIVTIIIIWGRLKMLEQLVEVLECNCIQKNIYFEIKNGFSKISNVAILSMVLMAFQAGGCFLRDCKWLGDSILLSLSLRIYKVSRYLSGSCKAFSELRVSNFQHSVIIVGFYYMTLSQPPDSDFCFFFFLIYIFSFCFKLGLKQQWYMKC